MEDCRKFYYASDADYSITAGSKEGAKKFMYVRMHMQITVILREVFIKS